MRLSPEKRKAILQLAFADYWSAAIAWIILWGYRQHYSGKADFFQAWEVLQPKDYLAGLILIPGGWLFLYLLSGTYFDLYRKSRLNEINRTLISSIIGSVLIALVAFANDTSDYSYFIKMTGRYLLIHTICTLVFRLFVLNAAKRRLVHGSVGFNTLIIGGNDKAIEIYKQLSESRKILGNIFKGFIYSTQEASNGMSKYLPQLGHLSTLEQIIDDHEIEEVIVAVDSSEHHLLENILTRLSYRPVVIKVLPDIYDIISGSVKTSNVYDAVLIHIYPDLLPKRPTLCCL